MQQNKAFHRQPVRTRIERMISTVLLISLFCFFLTLPTACGYHNPYVANSDAPPITLYRSMWKNNTNENGLENTLYNSLSNWLRKTTLIKLKQNADQAQYLLQGEVLFFDRPEISYGTNNVATELRARLQVNYKILDQESEKIIWEVTKTYEEPYLKSANPSQEQTLKDKALKQIAEDIAEEIYLHIINRIMRK